MAGTDRLRVRDELELRFPSDPRHIAAARAFVEQAALLAGLGEHDTARIVLATGEAIANVIRHCYGGRCDRDIRLTARIFADRLELHLQDYGRKVDPGELHSHGPDDGSIHPGGLGLHIIREVMDEVDLSFISGTGNCLTMVKFLDDAAGAGGAREAERGSQP